LPNPSILYREAAPTMTINIQIDAEQLEKLAYIGQQTHRDPNTLLSQAIDVIKRDRLDRAILYWCK
jgi:hypothetical protein